MVCYSGVRNARDSTASRRSQHPRSRLRICMSESSVGGRMRDVEDAGKRGEDGAPEEAIRSHASRSLRAAPQTPAYLASHCTFQHTATMASTAFKSFALANDILEVSPQDEIFRFDPEANKRLNREAPWTKECVRLLIRVCRC